MADDLLAEIIARAPEADAEIARLEEQRDALEDTIRRLRAFKRWAEGEGAKTKRSGSKKTSAPSISEETIRRVGNKCMELEQQQPGVRITAKLISEVTGIHWRKSREALKRLRDHEVLGQVGRAPNRAIQYVVYPEAPRLLSIGESNNGKTS